MATKQSVLSCLVAIIFIISSSYAKKTLQLKFPYRAFTHSQGLIQNINDKTKPYNTSYFTQVLDHFNYHPPGYQTFQQRYLINDTFWGGAETNAPIFVYTGNEGDIEWFTQNTGFLFEKAPHFKALLVFIEVISMPYNISSF